MANGEGLGDTVDCINTIMAVGPCCVAPHSRDRVGAHCAYGLRRACITRKKRNYSRDRPQERDIYLSILWIGGPYISLLWSRPKLKWCVSLEVILYRGPNLAVGPLVQSKSQNTRACACVGNFPLHDIAIQIICVQRCGGRIHDIVLWYSLSRIEPTI